jgi:hypothetical protein
LMTLCFDTNDMNIVTIQIIIEYVNNNIIKKY